MSRGPRRKDPGERLLTHLSFRKTFWFFLNINYVICIGIVELKSPTSNRLTVSIVQRICPQLSGKYICSSKTFEFKSIKSKVIYHKYIITKNRGQVWKLLIFQLIIQSTHTTYPSVPYNLSTMILERKLTSCTYFAGFVGIQPWKRPCTFCSPVIRIHKSITSGRLLLV